ncbi:MAG TPA: DNA cytosine methyltransferase [Chloroflexota bacterium]|nr:DNA cytosine methyltransferase [Chloroflexota bacterium]
MKSIDLFAGAGGLTLGLHLAGWDTVLAVEFDRYACATYRHNFPAVEVIEQDINSLSFVQWRGVVDLVAGGPPCQPFSVAGKQRSKEDPRDCVPSFIRVVKEVQPMAFLMENVWGLELRRHRAYLLNAIEQLTELGYVVRRSVLDAAEYGAPQHRKRLIVVGMRHRPFVFPAPTHGPRGQMPFVTAGAALRNPPPDLPNTAKIVYAKDPVLRPQPWDGMMVNGQGRPINLEEPCQTIPASAGGNRTHILDPRGVLVAYHAHLRSGGAPRIGEVEGVRRLTVAESARIQGFPDEFSFLGPQSKRYSQVGNAVPPPLARAVARALAEQLAAEPMDADPLEDEPYQLSLEYGLAASG